MKLKCIGQMIIAGIGTGALLISPSGFADEVELLTLKDAVVKTCPTVWEDINAELEVSMVPGDLWENDIEGKQTFIDYMAVAMTEAAPTVEELDLMASDKLTVATECATQRTALLRYLVEAMPNDILIAMDTVDAELQDAIGSTLGSAADNPGQSCKNIKERYPEAADGPYWIDVTGGDATDAMEVYCDMTTDGGGWTFVTYLTGANTNPKTHFEDPYGTYSVSREATSDDYSLGIMNELADTEIMFTVTTPDPQAAILAEGFVQFRYSVNDPLFNHGPIPCSPGGSFEYRLNHEPTLEYLPAEGPSCAGSIKQFNPKALTDTIYGSRGLITMRDGYKGVSANSGMGTKLSGFNKSAWIYVR